MAAFFSGCNQQSAKDEAGEKATSAAALKTIEIQVEGMTCTGCEQSIEKAVGGLDGITEVKADHQAGITTVTYDTVVASRDGIRAVIEETGYTVIRD